MLFDVLTLFNTYMAGMTQNRELATCIFLLFMLLRFLNRSNTVNVYLKLMTSSHL